MLHGYFPGAGCGLKGLDCWFREETGSEEMDPQVVVAQHLK